LIAVEDRILFHKWSKEIDIFTKIYISFEQE